VQRLLSVVAPSQVNEEISLDNASDIMLDKASYEEYEPKLSGDTLLVRGTKGKGKHVSYSHVCGCVI